MAEQHRQKFAAQRGLYKSDVADICERTFHYAARIVRLYQSLSRNPGSAGAVLGRQLLRSGTSIGANIQEAQSGESRADFIHKLGIAQKEARESLYWLRLLKECALIPGQRLEPLIEETDQLVAIVTTIIVNTKRRTREPGLGEG